MAPSSYLRNQFLIAMPNLTDPNFFHSVTYICEHNHNGAMGIIINQPTTTNLYELITEMEFGDLKIKDIGQLSQQVYHGGPVQSEQGFVIHQPLGEWSSTLTVSDRVGITTSSDIVMAIAEGIGPPQSLVAIGYAGWEGGQLEEEIGQNAWISGPADMKILFDTPPEKRWERSAALLGIDIKHISSEIGHA